MKKIAIVGASSAIAQETAKLFATDKCEILLAARNLQKIEYLANDLKVRGASNVHLLSFDAADLASHQTVCEKIKEALGTVDAVLIAHGVLPEQDRCALSFSDAEEAIRINFTSPVAFLTYFANYFEPLGKGTIAVISSVAGDRGRKSNYVYGSAKAALSTFLQGLRNRLSSKGVQVITIKPGFVSTPMTEHLPQGPLFASAQSVGAGIYRAMKNGADEVYLPWFWYFIMAIIKGIPERFFKKMSI